MRICNDKIINERLFGNIESVRREGAENIVNGWGFALRNGTPIKPSSICLVKNGEIISQMAPDIARDDVRQYLQAQDDLFGFSARIPATENIAGLKIYASDQAGFFYPLNLPALLADQDMAAHRRDLFRKIEDRLFAGQVARQPINPQDEMQNQYYEEAGLSAARLILEALLSSNIFMVGNILDIPSGGGRVARYLRAMFPFASLDCMDINAEEVKFCERAYNSRGMVLPHDIRQVDFDRQYDLIWVGSMFTHFREETVKIWLKRLFELLSPSGALLATFHGKHHVTLQRELYANGAVTAADFARLQNAGNDLEWVYVNYASTPEAGPNPGDEYGVSICSPAKVLSLVREVFPDGSAAVISFKERGWADHQDVLMLGRRQSKSG